MGLSAFSKLYFITDYKVTTVKFCKVDAYKMINGYAKI